MNDALDRIALQRFLQREEQYRHGLAARRVEVRVRREALGLLQVAVLDGLRQLKLQARYSSTLSHDFNN